MSVKPRVVGDDLLLGRFQDLGLGKGQDLVHVLQSVRVARQRKVDERDAKSSDILYRQIGSSLIISFTISS